LVIPFPGEALAADYQASSLGPRTEVSDLSRFGTEAGTPTWVACD
jgi:hypothetical protein